MVQGRSSPAVLWTSGIPPFILGLIRVPRVEKRVTYMASERGTSQSLWALTGVVLVHDSGPTGRTTDVAPQHQQCSGGMETGSQCPPQQSLHEPWRPIPLLSSGPSRSGSYTEPLKPLCSSRLCQLPSLPVWRIFI